MWIVYACVHCKCLIKQTKDASCLICACQNESNLNISLLFDDETRLYFLCYRVWEHNNFYLLQWFRWLSLDVRIKLQDLGWCQNIHMVQFHKTFVQDRHTSSKLLWPVVVSMNINTLISFATSNRNYLQIKFCKIEHKNCKTKKHYDNFFYQHLLHLEFTHQMVHSILYLFSCCHFIKYRKTNNSRKCTNYKFTKKFIVGFVIDDRA